ncbi:MAG: MFS transporter [Clostridia bacterium]|nr:MFS transporter [Clostridia bacterium]
MSTKKLAPTATYGYNESDFKKFMRLAWTVLLSFGLMYMFFYNGRQNINLVKNDIAGFFGFFKADGTPDASGISAITTTLFWSYAMGQLVNGRLGSYFGYKRYMSLGVIVSCICNVAISFVSEMWLFAVLWGLNGFAQSMVWSNGLQVLNKWWPKSKRGFSSGLATAFSGLGQVVTYLSVSLSLTINPDWGWRAAFRFPIIPLVMVLVAFIVLFKEQPEDVGLAPFEEEDKEAAARDAALIAEVQGKGFLYPYIKLFSEPKFIVFCFISAIAGIGRYGLLNWMPTYFRDAHGMDVKSAIFGSILLPLGQACAMFVFPFITDKVFKGKREPMLALASIVTFICLVIFPFITNATAATLMLFVVGVFSMVTGVIWAVAGDMGGRAFAATVVGTLDCAVYLGAALQEGTFGYFTKAGRWDLGFITIGGLYILMLVLTLLASKMKLKNL